MNDGVAKIYNFIEHNPDLINIEKKVFISDDETVRIGYYQTSVDVGSGVPENCALYNCVVRVFEDGIITLINAWLYEDVGEDLDLYELIDEIYRGRKKEPRSEN